MSAPLNTPRRALSIAMGAFGAMAATSAASTSALAATAAPIGKLATAANVEAARPVRIWCLGDSMTVGAEYIAGSIRSYRGRLYQMLVDAGYKVDFVGTQQMEPAVGGDPDHDGYGGAWIGPGGQENNLTDRLPKLLPAVDPDIIILAFGWNSIYLEPLVAAQKYSDFVNRLLAAKPNAKLVVATLNPQKGQTEAQSTATVRGFGQFNSMARSLANASPNDRVYLADYAAAGFTASEYWDVIHWFQPGADRAAKVIFQALVDGPLKR